MSRTLSRNLQSLVDSGLLTHEQLEHALGEAQRTGKSLGRVLLELRFVTDTDILFTLARWMDYESIDLNEYPIDPAAVGVLPEIVARRYRAIPVGFDDDKLVVAMSDWSNIIALDDIRSMTGREVKVVVASSQDIQDALNRSRELDRSSLLLDEDQEEEAEEEEALVVGADEATNRIVKAINKVISDGVRQRASDIHLEPQEAEVRIRYRIDGVLHTVGQTRKRDQSSMISRLKVMADLNIAEKRVPQDGRISFKVEGRPIDLRVATLPSVWGEKVVLRILDRASTPLGLDDLGFLEPARKRFEESFQKPYGAILVTGPTGSGKSTTLYATLNILNQPTKNIITVEDPVEYRLGGITQVQVHPKAGLTFAAALRSILRADPDIVMVGEMRDRETATIGVEAALTGHLVLSTLHTNDAPSAITRLTEMGVEPFLVASALDCVLAQRLARRLCDRCKEPYEPTPDILTESAFPWRTGEDIPTLYRPAGCRYCAKTGYYRRLALVEVMLVTEEIERLAAERRSSEDIRRVAIEEGMVTLREDGMEKVRLGMTSLEEVLRVVV